MKILRAVMDVAVILVRVPCPGKSHGFSWCFHGFFPWFPWFGCPLVLLVSVEM